MIAIESLHVITIRRSKVLKVSVLVGLRDDVPLVIRPVVAVPVVVVDVRHSVDAAAFAPFDFRFCMRFAALRRRLRNPSLIAMYVMALLRTLRPRRTPARISKTAKRAFVESFSS